MEPLTIDQMLEMLRTMTEQEFSERFKRWIGPVRLRERIAGAKTIRDGGEMFADLPERVDGNRRLA